MFHNKIPNHIFAGTCCALFLCMTLPAHAASLATTRAEKTQHQKKELSDRKTYDTCMGNAAQMPVEDQAKVQHLCRRAYALTRLHTPRELWKGYMEQPLEAQEQYDERLLAVRGTIYQISGGSMGYPEIILAFDDFGAQPVRCLFSRALG